MIKQSPLEKIDIWFGTVNENSEPVSSLKILESCRMLYNTEILDAESRNDANKFLYCQDQLKALEEMRRKIIIKYPEFH